MGRGWKLLLVGMACLLACSEGVSAADTIVPAGAKLETLWNAGEFTEGVAVAPDGMVYFSDIAIAAKNPGRILKFDPKSKQTTVHVADSGQSNGLCFTRDGTLIAACGANVGLRAICAVQSDGKMKPLVNSFAGKKLNAPNDLTIHPKGWIFFSDPRYVGPEPLELDHQSVFRIDPDLGIHRVTTDIAKPNGLIISPDGKTLYVADTDNGTTGVDPAGSKPRPPRYTLQALPIKDDGSLGPKRMIVDFGAEPGIDGMAMDTAGRIYAAVRKESRHGIAVYQPDGREVAFIPTAPLPTNCCFGRGDTVHTLYVTAGEGLYAITLDATGYDL